MNNQTIYWVWLQQVCGYGSSKISKVRKRYTFAEDFYKAPYEEKMLCFDGKEDALNFRDVFDRKLYNAEKIIRYCRDNDIEIVVPGDENYPELLLPLPNLPAALYVKGIVNLFDKNRCIGIVGTRHPSHYGEFMAKNIAEGLAAHDFTLVSGGAIGIDTIVHKAALEAKGKTICVLGCGIGFNYLKNNKKMYEEIVYSGALVSEYVPLHPTGKLTFRLRDRLISGISDSVVVVEAGKKSGSLITAEYALKQNRKLYALRKPDGSVLSPGAEEAIKRGAEPICLSEDIVLQPEKEYNKEYEEYKAKYIKDVYENHLFSLDFEDIVSKRLGFTFPDKEQKTVHSGESTAKTDKSNSVSESGKKSPVRTKKKSDKKNDDQKGPEVRVQRSTVDKDMLDALTDTAKTVYRSMPEKQTDADELSCMTGLSISDVNSALTELEIFGLVSSCQGNLYLKM